MPVHFSASVFASSRGVAGIFARIRAGGEELRLPCDTRPLTLAAACIDANAEMTEFCRRNKSTSYAVGLRFLTDFRL